MKKNRRVNKVLVKYVLLFGIIIAIPFLVLGFIINTYYLSYIKENAITQNKSILSKNISTFDNEIDQLYKTAVQLNLNQNFETENIARKSPLYSEILNTIRNIKGTNNFIDNLIFYSYGFESTIWTVNGTYNDFYYGSYIGSHLKTGNTATRFYKNDENYLYKETIPYASERPVGTIDYIVDLPKINGSVSFRITNEKLNSIFSLHGEENQLQLYIYTSEGKELYRLGAEAPVSEVLTLLEDGSKDAVVTNIGDNIFYKQYSPKSGLTYISVLSQKYIYQNIQWFTNVFLWASVFIVVVGSVLIVIFTRINYKPIKTLYDFALTKVDGASLSPEKDMIARVQEAIYTLDDNAKMKEKEQNQAQKEKMFFQLFQGGIQSQTEFFQAALELGVILTAPFYRVFVIRYQFNEDEAEKYNDVFLSMEDLMRLDYEANGINNSEQNQYILLVGSRESGEAAASKIVELISSVLFTGNSDNIFLGVSNECTSLSEVFRIYLQASHAAKFSDPEHKKVVYYSTLDVQDEIQSGYPRQELKDLFNAVISRNTVQIDFIITTLTNMISNYYQSMFLVICLCGDIFSTLMNAIGQLNPDCEKQYLEKVKGIDVSSFHTTSELINNISWIKKEIIILLEQYDRQTSKLDISAIQAYVGENCDKYDLTVGSIADHFSITPSNLSHQFKAQQGYNISDYINKERMRYAKELLLVTNFSVFEIADKLGYSQPSSFIRKFKQYESMTPGEFKKRAKDLLP